MQKQHLRAVEISIMPIGNTNIHKHINVSVFINKFSFHLCFVNLIVLRTEMKAKLSF